MTNRFTSNFYGFTSALGYFNAKTMDSSPIGSITGSCFVDAAIETAARVAGYVPILNIFGGAYHVFTGICILKDRGADGETIKGVTILARGIIELCGFGGIFLMPDFYVWYGREIYVFCSSI